MDTQYLNDLKNALTKTIVSIIKNKIDKYNINIQEIGIILAIQNPLVYNHYETIFIKSFNSEKITFKNDIEIDWTQIQSVNDLLKILELINNWIKTNMLLPDKISIEWGVKDFEETASKAEENGANIKIQIYDRSRFRYALNMLRKHHDCNYGITWVDIKYHLDEYCVTS